MSNWTDKDTDKLFQQGSEQYDFEYNPAAWEQMGKLLDRQKRRRLLLWWGAAVLLLTAFVFFLWDGKGGPGDDRQHAATTPGRLEQTPADGGTTAESADFIQTNKIPEAGVQEAASGKTGLGETGKQEPTLPHARGREKKRKADFHKTPPALRRPSQGISGRAATGTETSTIPVAESGSHPGWNGVRLHETPVVTGGITPNRDSLVEDSQLSGPDERAALLPGLTLLPILLPELVFIKKSPEFILPDPGVVIDKNKSIPTGQGNALVAGIAGGPEFNSVGFGDFSRLNWKYGLRLEYRYRERFGLGIGASYLHMSYVAGKDEFHLPATFPNLEKLVATRGTCNMLEVPLELSYYFGGYWNSGFFGTAGLASYFLFDEDYVYDYTYFSSSHINSWSTDKNGNYWFGIGSLSVGYNRWVSDRLAFRIAPYLQFPLRGVGSGEVKLYSAGLNIRFDIALTK